MVIMSLFYSRPSVGKGWLINVDTSKINCFYNYLNDLHFDLKDVHNILILINTALNAEPQRCCYFTYRIL